MLGNSFLILYFIRSSTVFQVEEIQTSKSLTGHFFVDVTYQTRSISKGWDDVLQFREGLFYSRKLTE